MKFVMLKTLGNPGGMKWSVKLSSPNTSATVGTHLASEQGMK